MCEEWNDVNERMIGILAVNVCQSLVNMSGQSLSSFTVSALAPQMNNNGNASVNVWVKSDVVLLQILSCLKRQEMSRNIFFSEVEQTLIFPSTKLIHFCLRPE